MNLQYNFKLCLTKLSFFVNTIPSSNACIMVLPKLTFVLLFSPFLSPLSHKGQFVVAPLHGLMEDLVTAVIVEVFIMLSFCLKTFCKMLDNTGNIG